MMIRRAMPIFLTTALFLLGIASPSAHAQEPDSAAVRAAFDSIVAAHTYTATLEDGQLTGPGADWLEARGRAVDHFLMGERHGTAEIPKVAATLYERLRDHGYGPVALEIGSFAGEATTEALRQGGYPALRNLVTRYESPPIAFLNRKEESEMAARMVEAGAPIWGIDYEFIYSLPMHLDALAEEAKTDRERTAVQNTRTKMKEAWGGETGPAVAAAPPSALKALRAAFEPRGDETALARIDALLESNAIYAPYVRTDGSFFESRVRRETLMKEQLIDHIRQWEAEHGEAPKVFHKNAHTPKHSSEGIYIPLGGFMAEWARARGEDTFHVMADCQSGQIPKTGQGGGGECTPWLGGEDGPFAKHLRENKITIIDLRALRPRYFDWDILPDKLHEAIVSIDAYIAIPDVQHSEPLNAVPRGE
ncbi:MAG: hypothetical protein ABEL04_14405 [Salinibacter sp.]